MNVVRNPVVLDIPGFFVVEYELYLRSQPQTRTRQDDPPREVHSLIARLCAELTVFAVPHP